MKKNFTQPFNRSTYFTARLLVETEPDKFIQFLDQDELGTMYASTLSLKIDETGDIAIQLAKFLYENSLVLNGFRQIACETSVSFSFADDTPGVEADEVCFHVRADQTGEPLNEEEYGEAVYVSLDQMLTNFRESPSGISSVGKIGIIQLMNERR
ncbi:hypothetical protein OG407_24000 [Streptomyces sp. NBC_01515]|uniref:hypothetical protein n=1 Tax=Streptomyces sp. NBC_01515 TaxID=2903890 RepID=UPI00386C502C